jgi:transposase InsO family protein
MYQHYPTWPISTMAKVLMVSTSGYYQWIERPNHPRHDQDALFQGIIHDIFERSKGTYGSPRIAEEMRFLGHRINEKRVARLMREMGLNARLQRRQKVTTTICNAQDEVAENILNRDFSAEKPNLKWVSDITYIRTKEGWLYLAVILDLFSRKVVGWSMDTELATPFVSRAFEMAIQLRQPETGLLFHSDRGCQYTSAAFRELLQQQGVIQSMSRRGECHDNAVAESFFHTLKTDLVYRRSFDSIAQARLEIFDYIAGFYNRQRRHSTINYLSPDDYEASGHPAPPRNAA